MKMSLIWHEITVNNMKTNIKRKEQELKELSNTLKQRKAEMNIYAHQVALAKEQGISSFDKRRFGLNLKK